jgi:hypothetical protein
MAMRSPGQFQLALGIRGLFSYNRQQFSSVMFSFYAPRGSDKEKPVGLLAFFICPMAVSRAGQNESV